MRFLSVIVFFSLLLLCFCGRDFYGILGIHRGASKNEIKKAFRRKAKESHPDLNKNDPKAEERFTEINIAYENLVDDTKRRIYDEHGEEGLEQHGRGGGGSDHFQDFFGSMFFGFGGSRQRGGDTLRGNGVDFDLWVSLEELYRGDFIEVTRKKMVKETAKGTRSCKCRLETRTTIIGAGQIQMHHGEVCDKCPNVKFVPELRTLEVEVEVGMRDGQVYPFAGEGEPHIDGEPGDLKFHIRQKKHSVFHRRGDNLYTNMTISLLESIIGFDKVLTHLDGHKVHLQAKTLTAPGTILVKKDEGMPSYENSRVFGSLYVTIDVAYPENRLLSDAERVKLIEVLSSDTASEKTSNSETPQFYNGLDVLQGQQKQKVTTRR